MSWLEYAPQPDTPPTSADDSSPTGTVLVVDDIPANVRLLSKILQLRGYQVFQASSGAEALEIIESENLDVVLLDVMMPGMNGFEVCSHIRALQGKQHLPVVFVTALSDVSDRVRAIEVGADDFISKPVEEIEVVARVKSLVRAKRGRDELELAYNHLHRSESLRDTLTQMLVHDLRTPLSGLLVSLDLLLNDQVGPLNETQKHLATIGRRTGNNLLSMINDLLDVAKLESGQMVLNCTPVCIPEIVDAALKDVEPIILDREAKVEFEWATNLPTVNADAGLLQRVLVNLLSNSLKFSPSKVKLTVGGEVRPGQNGDEVVLWIRDTGFGIPAEQQQRIWNKFGQVNRESFNQRSTGLGLTFCKLAIEAHHGTIGVESEVGIGSKFHFSLPL